MIGPGAANAPCCCTCASGHAPYREDEEEFQGLALAAGAEIAGEMHARLRSYQSAHPDRCGKLEELQACAERDDAELVLVDHPLTPGTGTQSGTRARSAGSSTAPGLILDIFALRARTFEGKLQVELAQLEHLSTRLVRGWTHLERQKGGIGLRGPGETQLETDRRLLGQRIGNCRRGWKD